MKLFSHSTRKTGGGLDPSVSDPPGRSEPRRLPLEHIEKTRWERIWPSLACGAGLFSDGYLNSFVKDLRCNLQISQCRMLTCP